MKLRSRTTGILALFATLLLALTVSVSCSDDDEGGSGGGTGSADLDAIAQERGLTPGCPDNVPHNRTSCAVATNTLDLEAADLTVIADYELTNGLRLTSISGWDRYEDARDEDDGPKRVHDSQ